ncbi:TetR/AcrR family transcriptional regulator [Oenococcus sicerae]|uniref:TetR/AcrR family transcriptional regulator n=1 Tax=Oenococcus sicerae TaxID=2203724 RepID=A0AAJ1RAW1_9LACO|nr:TetR/AcrR family transcriptional regulator [Oenococcus sicerae]MDN6900223.1 TetR/AcrR family transcriptional regulator [Oenococcus sicerae]
MKNATKGDLQKEKLLAAARKLFAENGYEATSTKKINQRIGAADGLLYYYFPAGKKQLLNEIIKQTTDNKTLAFNKQFDQLTGAESIQETLIKVFQIIWNILTKAENYETLLITVRERAVIEPEQINWLLRLADRIEQKIADYLRQQIMDQTLVDNDPGLMAELVLSVYESCIYRQLILADKRNFTNEVAQTLSEEINLLVKGWQPNSPRLAHS